MNKKIVGFNRQAFVEWLLYWVAVGVGFFVLTFLITSTWIGVSVYEKCLVAESKYGGNCAEALIATLDDPENSFRVRNSAIWALGQIGDPKASAVIEKYYTGDISDREYYDESLSQYEMKKALKLLRGGANITHLVWSVGD